MLKKVCGVLTVTSTVLIFEPNFHDTFVTKNGVLPYQLFLHTNDILDCELIRENEKYLFRDFLQISIFKDDRVTYFDFILDQNRCVNFLLSS